MGGCAVRRVLASEILAYVADSDDFFLACFDSLGEFRYTSNEARRDMHEVCSEIVWKQGISLIGDEDIYLELLSEYEPITREYLNVIRDAIAARDENTVQIKAHGIKGSSGNLAIPLVAAAAAELEKAARDHRMDDFPALYEKLEAEFAKVCALIAAELPQS